MGVLLWLLGAAFACEAVKPLPDTLQVAWVSPVRDRVSAHSEIPVVRAGELRALAQSKNRDQTAVLQSLGLVGKRGKVRTQYKVTVFDVKKEWLCRPSAGDTEGVPACDSTRRSRGIKRRSWTDCGYLLDSSLGVRTLDVFRIDWSEAVSWGFCVLPLERFLSGA